MPNTSEELLPLFLCRQGRREKGNKERFAKDLRIEKFRKIGKSKSFDKLPKS